MGMRFKGAMTDRIGLHLESRWFSTIIGANSMLWSSGDI